VRTAQFANKVSAVTLYPGQRTLTYVHARSFAGAAVSKLGRPQRERLRPRCGRFQTSCGPDQTRCETKEWHNNVVDGRPRAVSGVFRPVLPTGRKDIKRERR
jgi:hypothetical protein